MYSYRKMDNKREEQYRKTMEAIDWQITVGDDLDQKAATMHEKIMNAVNHAFPLVTNKVRSTEDPWIYELTRKSLKRRRAIFYE